MIGAGLDLGTSHAKGIALRLHDDGAVTVLAAVVVPVAELKARAAALAALLARRKPFPLAKVPLRVAVSGPDSGAERVRLAVPKAFGEVSESALRDGLFEGVLAPPGGLAPADDLWDFTVLRYFRRATDAEALGSRAADVLLTRVGKASAAAAALPLKGLAAGVPVPSVLASPAPAARWLAGADGGPLLVLDFGFGGVQAVLLAGGALVQSARARYPELADQVAAAGRVERSAAAQRIQNADVATGDPVSSLLRETVTRSLQQLNGSLWPEGSALPRPQRILLCGGLSPLRGMTRLANTILGAPAELHPQPDAVRTADPLPAPFPVFAGAIGAALLAAGAPAIGPLPRRQARPRRRKRVEAHHAALQPAVTAARRVERIAELLAGIGRDLASLPRRLGWTWVAAGVLAAAAAGPTLWGCLTLGASVGEAEREFLQTDADTLELEREADLLQRFVRLSGTGLLAYLPWGQIVASIAQQMPPATYVTRMKGNRDGLLITGRVKGNPTERTRAIYARLKDVSVLKRNGLTPPAI